MVCIVMTHTSVVTAWRHRIIRARHVCKRGKRNAHRSVPSPKKACGLAGRDRTWPGGSRSDMAWRVASGHGLAGRSACGLGGVASVYGLGGLRTDVLVGDLLVACGVRLIGEQPAAARVYFQKPFGSLFRNLRRTPTGEDRGAGSSREGGIGKGSAASGAARSARVLGVRRRRARRFF